MNLVTCWTICYKYAAKSSPHIQCLYMDRLDFKFQIRTCSLWNIILWSHTPFFIKQKIDWNLNLRQPIQYKFTNIFSSWVYCRYLKSSLYCQFSPICKVPNTGGLGYLSFIRSTQSFISKINPSINMLNIGIRSVHVADQVLISWCQQKPIRLQYWTNKSYIIVYIYVQLFSLVLLMNIMLVVGNVVVVDDDDSYCCFCKNR